jgi:large subunit ribosomal protein L22
MAIEIAPREATARVRHMRVSPTKVRQVIGLVRGKDIAEARDLLRLCERSVAHEVGKALESAVANADHNANLPEDELYISRAFVDEGPTAKRWRPRARGRGVRIRKRTSHLTIAVTRFDDDELLRRRSAEAAAGGTTRRRQIRPRRRAAAEDHDHDHDHDEEHDHGEEHDDATEAKKPRKTARKGTGKKATAKKSTAKKAGATKKASAKAEPSKKSTAKAEPNKLAPAKKRATKKDD